MDVYDQQVYAVGKGPSEMTLTSSNAVTNTGAAILVSGTVMDISPGTQQDNLKFRFSNGVPAVSDESQSDWMLYVYKGFDEPMNVKGIEITVYAYDGTDKIDIGKTTSDARGRFSIVWTPEKEGKYDIWAYFEGTKSYFGSDTKTEVAVLAAPAPVEQEPDPPYGLYIALAAVAIIVVMILCTIVVLRKK
ncbi:MAG: hypothetical protein LBH62_03170 [Nitrososphaerota archaeon]|jgi:hypothetical protein|nr:hypothetical protein [Nitrososphaerota archaeon]